MEKINIAELLKDCPNGMELDCLMYEGVVFDCIADEDILPIRCCIRNPKGGYNVCHFTEYGCWSNIDSAKCVIFPKGKTTWEGFTPPKPKFKCGDVVACDCSNGDSQLFIFKEYDDNYDTVCYLFLDTDGTLDIDEFAWKIDRLATEEERQKLFDAIKSNGYRWNPETKTLEKLPKFKVGNRIKEKDSNADVVLITDIADNYYIVETKYGMKVTISISIQDNYELVLDNFDVTTLKPFDKVLVRDNDRQMWAISFFSHCNGLEIYKYSCINGGGYEQCIPYEKNEHLLGTTNDCEEYYKTW